MTRIQTAKSDEDIIRKVNRLLKPDLKQCAVLLSFCDPVSIGELRALLAIKLYKTHIQAGEDDFYMIGLEDKQAWTDRLSCMVCRTSMKRGFREDVYVCSNGNCSRFNKQVWKCRGQGVKRLVFGKPMVSHIETRTWQDCPGTGDGIFDVDLSARPVQRTAAIKYLNSVVVLLDRRYPDTVLAAVYRSCGTVGDLMGWRLKQ